MISVSRVKNKHHKIIWVHPAFLLLICSVEQHKNRGHICLSMTLFGHFTLFPFVLVYSLQKRFMVYIAQAKHR